MPLILATTGPFAFRRGGSRSGAAGAAGVLAAIGVHLVVLGGIIVSIGQQPLTRSGRASAAASEAGAARRQRKRDPCEVEARWKS